MTTMMKLCRPKVLLVKLRNRLFRRIIFWVLAILALFHLRFLLSMFITEDTTVFTDAAFHNEKNRLRFPNLFLCFSKVFTYSRLKSPDIHLLYNTSTPGGSGSRPTKYRWSVDIGDLILSAKLYGQVIPLSQFQSVFYLPTQTCWKLPIADGALEVGRPGSVHTLDLTINAAVYDDMLIDYNSPLTYLSIVPYLSMPTPDQFIPPTRSSVQISPGTFSAVGFTLTKMDSTHRTARDKRSCERRANSKERCLSMLYRSSFLEQCAIDVRHENISAVSFGDCGLKLPLSERGCQLEPCKIDLFRFSKSEAYLKYDPHLGSIGIDAKVLNHLKSDVRMATRLDSQFNPYVRNSFRQTAQGMDVLTSEIATLLSRSRGYVCPHVRKQRTRLTSAGINEVPNVSAEREHLARLRRSFVSRSSRVFSNLIQSILDIQYKYKPLFETQTPFYLGVEIWNTKSVVTTEAIQAAISQFRTFFFGAITDVDSLREQASKMIISYNSLRFTKFIRRYSSLQLTMEYNRLLLDTVRLTGQAKSMLFYGDNLRRGHFAHQDVDIKRTVSRRVNYDFARLVGHHNLTSVYRDPWMQYAWLINKGIVVPRSFPPVFGIIYGPTQNVVQIPVFVDIFCGFYHNYLANAERFHGSETAFSIRSSNVSLRILEDYSVFALNQIFLQYDTYRIVAPERNVLDDVERASCARFSIYPVIYVNRSTSPDNVIKDFERKSCRYFLGRAGRSAQLFRMFAWYTNRLSRFQKTSRKFESYYRTDITTSVGPAMSAVGKLRVIFGEFEQFKIEHQQHKVFLISRLKKLALLVRNTLKNDSEELISDYLSRKGRILIGEIQIEISAVSVDLYKAHKTYRYYRSVINDVIAKRSYSSSVMRSVVRGVMTSNFYSNFSAHSGILDNLHHCNEDRWSATESHLTYLFGLMEKWVRIATVLVARARRYTNSIQITKLFLRQNLMIVSLYYDSLTVLTETLARPMSVKSLVGKVGAVLRIYIRKNLFHFMDMFTSAIAFLFGLKLWKLVDLVVSYWHVRVHNQNV